MTTSHNESTEFDHLLAEVENAVLTITINRPDKLNALNEAVLLELSGLLSNAMADDDIRAVVVTGAGDKAFVAGADIGEIQQLGPVQAQRFSALGQGVFSQLENLGKPVIAAINGFALGGGCELALACTLRLASDTARLGLPEINLGIMPGFGGTQRLVRLVGKGRAMEAALTGNQIDADTAAQWGLVNRVVPADDLQAEAGKLASQLANAAPLAVEAILDVINGSADLPLEAGLEQESARFAVLCGSEDMQEGTTAFLEKRKADFSGR